MADGSLERAQEHVVVLQRMHRQKTEHTTAIVWLAEGKFGC